MRFEYIRPIPSPAAAHEPLPLVPAAELLGDEPELAELVAQACALVPDDAASLACPAPPPTRVALPRFSGSVLADVTLPALASVSDDERRPLIAPLAPQPRVLLGPGAMTMTLALVATLAFGVFVATH